MVELMGPFPHIWMFFVFFVVLTAFAVLNIVTSIIVETTFSQVRSDQDEFDSRVVQERELLVSALQAIFEAGDVDRSGQLSFEEFTDCLDTPLVKRKLEQIGVGPD